MPINHQTKNQQKSSINSLTILLFFIAGALVILGINAGLLKISTAPSQNADNLQLTTKSLDIYSQKPIDNPIKPLGGSFLTESDSQQQSIVYLCANSKEHAKEIIKDYFYTSVNENDIVNLEVYPEYIAVHFAKKIRDHQQWNILRCDYFIDQASFSPYQDVQLAKLGIFKGKPSKESLNYLIWFLIRIGVVELEGSNQGVDIYKSDIFENDKEIVRIDQGIYWTANDVPPFETRKLKVEYEYRLRKSDGQLFYSRIVK